MCLVLVMADIDKALLCTENAVDVAVAVSCARVCACVCLWKSALMCTCACVWYIYICVIIKLCMHHILSSNPLHKMRVVLYCRTNIASMEIIMQLFNHL